MKQALKRLQNFKNVFSRTVTDSTNKYVVHIQAARKNLESDHGDPFTLLNAFDEWIQVQLIV